MRLQLMTSNNSRKSNRSSLTRGGAGGWFSFYIARRYLFSKKSTNVINIISGISVLGVAVATMAMVVTLSVFNGFQDLVAGLFTAFDPQLRVSLAEGKTTEAGDEELKALRECPLVEVYTPVLEDQALVYQEGRQVVVTIKGVDDNFSQLTYFNEILYPDAGQQVNLHAGILEYGLLLLALH